MYERKVEITNQYGECITELKEMDGYYYFPFDKNHELPLDINDTLNVKEIEREV